MRRATCGGSAGSAVLGVKYDNANFTGAKCLFLMKAVEIVRKYTDEMKSFRRTSPCSAEG